MSNKRNVWFQKNSQQSVFMKVATLPVVNRSGPVQAITEYAKPKKPSETYFTVGETPIGGEEIVGG